MFSDKYVPAVHFVHLAYNVTLVLFPDIKSNTSNVPLYNVPLPFEFNAHPSNTCPLFDGIANVIFPPDHEPVSVTSESISHVLTPLPSES